MNRRIILALGSNIGDRSNNLSQAIELIGGFSQIVKTSSIRESEALLVDGSPKEWNLCYLNMALECHSSLSPQELLHKIKNIEKSLGRDLNSPYWSPREIDIDIILYDNLVLNEADLQIPHKHLCEREFVLRPLCDIIPDWKHPINHNSMAQLLALLPA